MVKQASGKSVAQASAKSTRPEPTSRETERAQADLGELARRLTRDEHGGSRGVRDAAFALQRAVGNQATARRLDARRGDDTRSVGDVARSGFQGASGRLPYMAKIQRSFGAHDIRGVHTFTGPHAAAASRALSADAYASGERVVFADPAPSLRVAAHEAAHVVQQRAGLRLPGGLGSVGDAHERHADAIADKVVRGESAERSLDTYFSSAGSRGGAAVVQRVFAPPLLDDVETEKDQRSQIRERYMLLIDNLRDAVAEDPSLSFNPDAVLAPILFRLEHYEGDFTYETYGQLIEALKTRGAILVNGKESGTHEAPQTKKYTLNLVMPGSGDSLWRTFAENMLGAPVATRKKQFSNVKEIGKKDQKRELLGVKSKLIGYPTFYEDVSKSDTETTYVIRGPNSSNLNSGQNDIATNIKTGLALADYFITKYGAEGLKVRIMGHSRNGVAASRVARDLRSKNPGLEIDAVIFDPVPGADANLVNTYSRTFLSEDETSVNSTVIYSLMDARVGFNPTMVHGARRLILSHYSHHAGLEHGFMFKNKHYKGLSLLELPEGLFVDEKQSPGKPNVLTGPYYNENIIDKVMANAKELKADSNKNRIANLRVVVSAFLKNVLKNSHYDESGFFDGS